MISPKLDGCHGHKEESGEQGSEDVPRKAGEMIRETAFGRLFLISVLFLGLNILLHTLLEQQVESPGMGDMLAAIRLLFGFWASVICANRILDCDLLGKVPCSFALVPRAECSLDDHWNGAGGDPIRSGAGILYRRLAARHPSASVSYLLWAGLWFSGGGRFSIIHQFEESLR